jgi:hypothetical protein
VTCLLQQNLCALLSANYAVELLVDSFPIELCNLQRLKSSSQPFQYDGATYGFCAAKKEHYYGFKGHLVSDLRGIPIFLVMTSAAMSDLHAIEFVITEMLKHHVLKGTTFFIGDKGYVGKDAQAQLADLYNVKLVSMEREYRPQQYGPSPRNEFLRQIRKQIETTINLFSVELQAGWTHCRTIKGLITSLVNKMLLTLFATFLLTMFL